MNVPCLLTVLRVAAAAAVAAYVFDLLANVAVNHKGHVVVMMLLLLLLWILILLPVIQRHHPDQAEALVLRLLHPLPRGRVIAPDAVHDCMIHHRHDGGDGDDERVSKQDWARALRIKLSGGAQSVYAGHYAPSRLHTGTAGRAIRCSAGLCLKSQWAKFDAQPMKSCSDVELTCEYHTHTHTLPAGLVKLLRRLPPHKYTNMFSILVRLLLFLQYVKYQYAFAELCSKQHTTVSHSAMYLTWPSMWRMNWKWYFNIF